jgi:AcrR family transcriptional regulator
MSIMECRWFSIAYRRAVIILCMSKDQSDSGRTPSRPAASVRLPQQRRSKQRADTIVEVSRALIARHGILGLKMTEIAKRAGVPIGSVCQYFPTKSGLISHLFARNLDTYHELASRTFAKVTSVEECVQAFRRVARLVYRDNRRDSLMREIWSGVQADRAIRQLHLADNEFFSQLFFDTICRVGSPIPKQKLFRRCQIVNEMWDGTIRLAITLEESVGARLIEESLELGLADLGLTKHR